MRVPAGTQPGTMLRIKGKGMPHRGGLGRGDQRVEVMLEVPTQLTRTAARAPRAARAASSGRTSAIRKGFMEQLRDLFG